MPTVGEKDERAKKRETAEIWRKWNAESDPKDILLINNPLLLEPKD